MKKYNYLLLSTLIAISSSSLFAQSKEMILQDFRVDVIYLASDLLEGRATGSPGEELAATYIASRFEEVGLKPKGDDDSWFHHFEFKHKEKPSANSEKAEKRSGKNVVGYLDNGAAQTIIIGAHYDHLGWGESGNSLHANEKVIHNGADDNASGVAVMIRLAEYLKTSGSKNNNYLFLAFSGEELGLIGSKKYTLQPSIDLTKVNYMINMDMVGRLNEEKKLLIYGVGTSPAFLPALEKINIADISIKTGEDGVGASDHTSFYLKDIPVLHFFTGQHSDYHKPGDDSHLVNYKGMYEVSRFIIRLIEDLNPEPKLTFTKTKTEVKEKKRGSYKVTLGVMPDYVYEGNGMKIDSVIEDRPGHKGGLEDGDVVVKIGDHQIKDIYTYMDALAKYKKGDKVEVTVVRNKKEVTKKVVF